MQVQSELDSLMDPFGSFDDFDNLLSPSMTDIEDISSIDNSESLLSDDIWKKFQLDFPELSRLDAFLQEFGFRNCAGLQDTSLFPTIETDDHIHHDCMWAGHCASKEHPEDTKGLCALVPIPPVVKPQLQSPQTTPAAPFVNPQSVLKPRPPTTTVVNPASVLQHTPQTPPESDDEEIRTKTKIFQQTHVPLPIISETSLEEDSDLREYFEEPVIKEEPIEIKEEPIDIKEEEDEEEDDSDEEDDEHSEEERRRYISYTAFAAENDHSYYKDKNAAMRNHNFGLDTPSDSEDEEIDVVSVTDKLITQSRMVCSLPTNPSTRDRQQLQRRMATAISKSNTITNHSGIKTILPIRKQTDPCTTTSKRRGTSAYGTPTTSRGVKRGKGYHRQNSKKKRQYFSDSETEPSEKRSLHNNMERQRRIGLRNAFEDLRRLVPEVAKKERAAKVVILREAAQYCDYLGAVSSNYTRQEQELRRKQEWLRQRVSQLRRSLAAKR